MEFSYGGRNSFANWRGSGAQLESVPRLSLPEGQSETMRGQWGGLASCAFTPSKT